MGAGDCAHRGPKHLCTRPYLHRGVHRAAGAVLQGDRVMAYWIDEWR